MAEGEADVGCGAPCGMRIAVAIVPPIERQQRSGQPGSAGQQLVLPFGSGTGDRKLEQLPRHTERELVLELMAARREQLHPRLLGSLCRLRQQRSLADSGRTLDHHDPARTLARVTNRRAEQAQLMRAFKQQRVGSGLQQRVVPGCQTPGSIWVDRGDLGVETGINPLDGRLRTNPAF